MADAAQFANTTRPSRSSSKTPVGLRSSTSDTDVSISFEFFERCDTLAARSRCGIRSSLVATSLVL